MLRIAVVGGGVIGLSIARELTVRGHDVRVYERGRAGAESSWAGAGVLSPLPPWRYPAAVQCLAHAGQALYPALVTALAADTGIDPEWTRSGLLVLEAPGEDAARWAQDFAQRLEWLEAGALHAKEPALAPAAGALWLPETAQVRNPRLLRALIADLSRRGVAVHQATPVERLDRSGGRVTGVETSAGRIECDAVVLAAGAWSAELLAGMWQPPVRPVRGQMVLYEAGPSLLRSVVLRGDGRYLVPRRDGRLLVGSTVEHAGFDRSPTAQARADLIAAAAEMLPALERLTPAAHWAGLRPATADGVPIIGRHPQLERLWLATGHYRNGFTMAPATATLLADLIEGRTPALDPAPYATDRP